MKYTKTLKMRLPENTIIKYLYIGSGHLELIFSFFTYNESVFHSLHEKYKVFRQ